MGVSCAPFPKVAAGNHCLVVIGVQIQTLGRTQPKFAKLIENDMKKSPKPTNEQTSTDANKRKRRNYDPSLCDTVRELGRAGHSILEVSEITGISHSTLCGWEKRVPEFREAFAGVRKASEYRKKLRLQRLLAKDERRLLIALARVRAQSAAARRKLEADLAQV